jgi:hypothetical protein
VKKETKSIDFEVKVTHVVSRERVSDLLTSAFEGGSNYWYRIEKFHAPKDFDFNAGESLGKPAGYYKQIDYPLNHGGYLIVSDFAGCEDGNVRKKVLNLSTIRRGLNALANSKEYSHHWRDFIEENDDATTADVFLQFCLFGDVMYG